MAIVSAVRDANSKKIVITEVKVVPWNNAADFQEVYEHLYSPDTTMKNWALDQIAVWKIRCHPNLPAAIDVTRALAIAYLLDEEWTMIELVHRQVDIEQTYMTAILKFVNWFMNSHKDLVTRELTTVQVAKKLGIPSYIVGVRNEAAHSCAPSLEWLRFAAEDSIMYLKSNYWEIEVDQVKNYVMKAPDTSKAKQLISQFKKIRLPMMRGQEKQSIQEASENQIKFKQLLDDIGGLIEENKNLFIKELVKDGQFIPRDEDLKLLVVNEKLYKLYELDYDVKAEDFIHDHKKKQFYIPGIPKWHQIMWVPIIYRLNLCNAVPLFMEALLRSLGHRTIAGQKLIISWILEILKIHNVNDYANGSILRRIFKNRGMIVNWHGLFRASMENPCLYTSFVFPIILSELNLDREEAKHMMYLYGINSFLTTNDDIIAKDQIFTVEDILEARKSKSGESNGWSEVKDDIYKKWPVGIILNPVINIKEEDEDEDEDEYLNTEDEEKEYKFKFIICNENDTEEHYYQMEIDDSFPIKFLQDFMGELKKRETLLYN